MSSIAIVGTGSVELIYDKGLIVDLKQLILTLYNDRPFISELPKAISGSTILYDKHLGQFRILEECHAISTVFTSTSFLMEIQDWDRVIAVLRDEK